MYLWVPAWRERRGGPRIISLIAFTTTLAHATSPNYRLSNVPNAAGVLHCCYSNGHIFSSCSTIIIGLILIQGTYLHDGSWALGSSRDPGGGWSEAR